MRNFIHESEKRWTNLTSRYLPVEIDQSIWRSCETRSDALPTQGWKIHIGATVLNACDILEKIGPLLQGENMHFKGIASLIELKKLNCGLHYGYSQIGKCLTVYARDEGELKRVAPLLDDATRSFSVPAVPFDVQLGAHSAVFYRYGAFTGDQVTAPNGDKYKDERKPKTAVPVDRVDPFAQSQQVTPKATDSPLRTRFKVYSSLSQRGKGGVYRALDLGQSPARICVVKEGRELGETDWDGRDGRWRIQHEHKVLSALQSAGLRVPCIYKFFEEGVSAYLALENLEGHNLQQFILEEDAQPLPACYFLIKQLIQTMASLHETGWAWRDCKPLNFILGNDGEARPLDFEGASAFKSPDTAPWGTSGYVPPEWNIDPDKVDHRSQDIYALAMTVRQILEGKIPFGEETETDAPITRRIPSSLRELLDTMASSTPSRRPSAKSVASTFDDLISDDQLERGRQLLVKTLRNRQKDQVA